MEDLYDLFLEGLDNGWFNDQVTVVRRNGQIVDFLLEGEELSEGEVASVERVRDVFSELEVG